MAKVDGSGFGKWFIAMLLFSFVIGRMKSSVLEDGSTKIAAVIFPFFIMLTCYILYNCFCNPPQIIKMLPYNFKKEVKVSILYILRCIVYMLLILGILVLIELLCFWLFGVGAKEEKMTFTIIGNEIFSKKALFLILYYILFTASVFPLIFVKKVKSWYAGMIGVLAIYTGFTILMINLLPESQGKFALRGEVFTNFETIDGNNIILIIMGVCAFAAICLSYQIAIRLNRPVKYFEE
jgi:hypothetical protein